MKPEVLERAIRLNDSIKNIDHATDFRHMHENENKKVFLTLQLGFGENAAFLRFTKDIQDFFLHEALPMYRAHLVDELDKL